MRSALLIALLAVNASAQYKAADVTISYVSGTSPTYILGLDNNLDICLAMTAPATLAEIQKRGIAVSDSQRVLLQAFNILRRVDKERFQCRLPVFREAATNAIRAEAGVIAKRIAAATAQSRERFLRAVAERGFTSSSYSLLGSLVLDRLVWTELEQAGLLASADAGTIESGSKLWSGAAWILLPPASWKFGTNSTDFDGAEVSISWSPRSLDAVAQLSRDLQAALAAAAKGNATAHGQLETLGLARDGALTVPVIASGDPLHATARALAKEVAANYATAFDNAAFARDTGVTDRTMQTLIMWHEVFPALMHVLEAGGLKRPPAVDGQTKDLHDVVFVVRKAK